MLGITLTHTTEAEHCSKLFTVETRTSGSWVHIYQVMVETRSVDVLFGLWWLFGANPQKKNMETNTPRHSGENQFSRKKLFGGGMLSASGDTISEWNGWCVHHPPKKNNGRDARDDAGPKVHGIDFYQSKVFWKSETVDTAVAHCLKDATVEGVEHISTVETAVAAARPQIYRFFCVVFPQFFFHCCLGCECWSCSFISQPPTENHSGFHINTAPGAWGGAGRWGRFFSMNFTATNRSIHQAIYPGSRW